MPGMLACSPQNACALHVHTLGQFLLAVVMPMNSFKHTGLQMICTGGDGSSCMLGVEVCGVLPWPCLHTHTQKTADEHPDDLCSYVRRCSLVQRPNRRS